MQVVLQPPQGRVVLVLPLHRDEERERHTRERRMHPGLQHRHPQHHANEDIGRDRQHAAAVEHRQRDHRSRGDRQRDRRKLVGVGHRDDGDGAEVVEDREGEQEHFQPDRHPAADQGQHAERECNVGRGGDRPAADRDGVTPVAKGIDPRGQQHAAQRGDGRQRDLRRVGQVAFQHLPLELEPHQQEEHRHQPVVDPEEQGLGDLQRADAHFDRDLEQGLVKGLRGRIGDGHGRRRGDHQQDAARRFELEEGFEAVQGGHSSLRVPKSVKFAIPQTRTIQRFQ